MFKFGKNKHLRHLILVVLIRIQTILFNCAAHFAQTPAPTAISMHADYASYALLEVDRERRAAKRHNYSEYLAVSALVIAAVALTLGAVAFNKADNTKVSLVEANAASAHNYSGVRRSAGCAGDWLGCHV